MALANTTVVYAINSYQTEFDLAVTTSVTAPVPTTGVGLTYLYVESELMLVTAVPVTGHVKVVRGIGGTEAIAHIAGSIVLIGLPSDFPNFRPQVGAFQTRQLNRYQAVSAPVAAAASITAPGALFHVTGVTATNIIVPPSNFVEGSIQVIADGLWTWTSSAVANGIAQSGAASGAGTTVTFTYDAATTYWYPVQSTGIAGPIAVTAAVTAATTIVASGPLFHVTGVTATNIITPPSNFTEGSITIIADGTWTWVSSNVSNGIAMSGAVTSAAEAVTFTYDATTARWYASRRA